MRQAVFAYKTVKGPLHSLPPMLKLFFLLPLSGFCMSLSPLWLGAGIIAAIAAAFLCRFTLREQLTDLKPAAFYAAIMYALSVFSTSLENWNKMPPGDLALAAFAAAFIPKTDFLRAALSLALVVQLSALLFRTTSSTEIRDGLNAVERFIRRAFSRLPLFGKRVSLRPRFAENTALFLSFIPEIFAVWSGVNLAWKARGGRQGLAKIKTLVFVLISLSFEKAALKAKALEARGNNSW
jgi:biotin transport system permease protein/energy-coupling factor transport system permease protein